MPLYEYQCDRCGHRFELIRKFSDPPVDACPACGGPVQKLQAAPAFRLKGSGWYLTDYAQKDRRDRTETRGKKDEPAATAGSNGSSPAGSTDSTEKKTSAATTTSAPSSSPASPAAPSSAKHS